MVGACMVDHFRGKRVHRVCDCVHLGGYRVLHTANVVDEVCLWVGECGVGGRGGVYLAENWCRQRSTGHWVSVLEEAADPKAKLVG